MMPPSDPVDRDRTDADARAPARAGAASASDRRDEPTRVVSPDASRSASGSGSGAAGGPAGTVAALGGPAGPQIEGYALLEEIHRGGQGVVYRALQLGTKRQVALKVLLEGPFAGETTRRRFEREIELAASLRHPNIVTILDSGISLGRYYFAMEYIAGVRLDRYIAQRRPPLPRVLVLFEKICQAVNFAHQRGVIHRDLKPPNILVDDEGEPHILDFGLAKPVHRVAAGESTVEMLSLSGQLLGTVAYMSPEQAAGSQDVDVRSDVYSLGVIFYDALVGAPPYPLEGTLAEVLTRIAHDEPANPRSLAGRSRSPLRIDDELATILLKALEKEPARRYQSAADLARDLRHRLEGRAIEAKRASGLYVLRKTLRRYRFQTAMGGIILLMLIGFLIAFAVLFSAEREARQRADDKTAVAGAALRSQADALAEARAQTHKANEAGAQLRRALVREHIQRGDLALQRGELLEARDRYWDAQELSRGPAAMWALRRYHLQTANSGAALLALESHGPTRLAPDGRLAAVCAAPESIWIREVDGGRMVGWVHTPGPVTHLDLRSNGALAAAGPGWARAWPPGALRPAAAVELPETGRPQAVFAVDDGAALLLVGKRIVRLAYGPAGPAEALQRLQGGVVGPCDYEPAARCLAVPTEAGLELVSLTTDGLKTSLVWTDAARPPRAARFDGPDTLAVLADTVYVGGVAEPSPGSWRPLIEATHPDGQSTAAAPDKALPPSPSLKEDLASESEAPLARSAQPRPELFDVSAAEGRAVLASRDGQVRLVGAADVPGEEEDWKFTVSRLDDVRLAQDDRAVLALDDRGMVTRWVHPARVMQRRQVLPFTPTSWATATDGSVVLLAAERGRVLAYRPEDSPTPRTIIRPRLLRRVDEAAHDRLALAVNVDGSRAVVRDGPLLRYCDFEQRAIRNRLWNHPTLTVVDQVALSGDGTVAALLARSALGDRQRVVLRAWPEAEPRFQGPRLPPGPRRPPPATPRSPGSGTADDSGRAPGRSDEPELPADEPGDPRAGSRDSQDAEAGADLAVFDFVGALVRDIAFQPDTHALLVVRSNGQLFMLNPHDAPPAPATVPAAPVADPTAAMTAVDAWMELGTPAVLVAFSRSGEYLAVACEDGIVRVIDPAARAVRHRLPLGRDVAALAFNPRDDILLVRGLDGTVRLYDPATGEGIAEWPQPAGGSTPLATWIGEADAMLLSTGNGVYEHRYDQADQLIEQSRAYTRQRQVARHLEAAEWDAAWDAAGELEAADPALARDVRISVLAAAVRQPRVDVPPDWIASVLDDSAQPWTWLQLGHAAYLGERFELAGQWLARGRALAGGTLPVSAGGSAELPLDAVDVYTLWRLGECEYLAGAYGAADSLLSATLAQPDLDPRWAPTIILQRVAALVRAGQPADARQLAQRIGGADAWGRPGDLVAVASARIIARLLTGLEDETLASAAIDDLLTRFDERSLTYWDDGPFFAGELAAQRDDLGQAAVQYQRCIDLARDAWPANWARYRLANLAGP